MKYFLVLVVLLISSCVERGGNDNSARGTKIDPLADEIYNGLMDAILGQKLSDTANGSHFRPGMKHPYRENLGTAHKALSACLAWDLGTKQVSHMYSYTQPSPDWGYAEFGALKGCESKKLQNSLNCNCQVIDHDDVNVLRVPDDFRRVYKTRLTTASVIK
ncbi:MAG: hypothetical protein V7740_17275 [Pseudomonas marincola]